MEKGDVLTIAGGLVIVVVLALIVNPQYLAGVWGVPSTATPTAAPVVVPATTPVPSTTIVQTILPAASPQPTPAIPYRIYYSDSPFTYPVVRLPDRLDMVGESDIRRSGQETVTFAYMADTRGGLSRRFSVPYPVWTLDIRVFDNTTPNVASFRMALCYASNGTMIDGTELIHPGNAFKRIQTSNTPLYLIISTADIEGYRLDLHTSRQYYEEYGAPPPSFGQ